MCRSIKPLYNFDPPVTDDDIRAAALQYVRKISGYTKPSRANAAVFQTAVDAIADISSNLLQSLETTAQPRRRKVAEPRNQPAITPTTLDGERFIQK